MKINKQIFFTGIFSPSFINTYYRKKILKLKQECVKGFVLDIGCGSQINKIFYKDLYSKYIGLDRFEIFLKVDQMGTGGVISNYEFELPDVSATADQLPFIDNVFDTVLLTEVLEHLEEPHYTLLEIKRVLKKDGCLVLTVPFILGEHQQPHDYFRFTRYGLRKYLKEWSELSIIPYNNNIQTVLLLLNSCVFFDFIVPIRKYSKLIFHLIYHLLVPLFTVINLLNFIFSYFPCSNTWTLGFFVYAKK